MSSGRESAASGSPVRDRGAFAERPSRPLAERRMAALDSRLLRRGRPARVLLGGRRHRDRSGAVLVMLAAGDGAGADRGAGRFPAPPWGELTGEIGCSPSCSPFAGLLAWQFEAVAAGVHPRVLSRTSAGARRAPTAVHRPGALGRRGGRASYRAVAVQGVDALERYFGRYLPQVVLGCSSRSRSSPGLRRSISPRP